MSSALLPYLLPYVQGATRQTITVISPADARKLPLPDANADQVLSPGALGLHEPVAIFARELARVLKPGGRFWGVSGVDGASTQGLMAEIHQTVLEFVSARHPELKIEIEADPGEFFPPALGFGEPKRAEMPPLEITTESPGIWAIAQDLYPVHLLAEADQKQLKKSLIALGNGYWDVEGNVHLALPLRLFTISKNRSRP